jgi:hypothetical protein
VQSTFLEAWFATQSKVESISKLWVLSDRGTLDIHTGGLSFSGRQYRLRIENVEHVRLVNQQIPWVTLLASNGILIVGMETGLLSYRLRSVTGLVVLALLNVAMLAVGLCTKWVEVKYRDDSGDEQLAYFANGSGFGWGGIFGGTAQMYEELKRIETKAPAS